VESGQILLGRADTDTTILVHDPGKDNQESEAPNQINPWAPFIGMLAPNEDGSICSFNDKSDAEGKEQGVTGIAPESQKE
jgi:hypothetical protein